MKSKILTVMLLLVASKSFAAGDFRSELNTILSNYVQPALVILLIVAAGYGVHGAIDLISDKDGRGTTKQGYIQMALVVGGAALAYIGIDYAVTKFTSISLQM